MSLQLHEDGGLDWHALETAIRPETQCALIQRSCGYSWRKTLTIADIERAIIIIKASGHGWSSKVCFRISTALIVCVLKCRIHPLMRCQKFENLIFRGFADFKWCSIHIKNSELHVQNVLRLINKLQL
jgi:hypothetical protein